MPNQLKQDPTRTTTIRNQFVADMVRRFRLIKQAINQAIIEADALGLKDPATLQLNIDQQAWRFQTNPQKVRSFRTWLQGEVDQNILTRDGLGRPWTAKYIDSAYKKGVIRSYTEVNKLQMLDEPSIFGGTKAQFIRSTFSAPETLTKIELLYERAFTELQGVTAVMDQQLSRVLAAGLSEGRSPRVIARQLNQNVDRLTNTRAKVIARTEIIRAHSEGQLDSFEILDIKELRLMAEWLTAGDDLVCPQCAELEGVVMTIKEARGLLPRHPNCRCMWLPANIGEPKTGQLWGPDKDRAVGKSIQKEASKTIKRSAEEVRRRSVWIGKELIKGKRVSKVITPKPVPKPKFVKEDIFDIPEMKVVNKPKYQLLREDYNEYIKTRSGGEKTAIDSYRSGLSQEINLDLRVGTGKQGEMIDKISDLISNAPNIKKDTVVYRFFEHSLKESSHKIGNKISLKEFASASSVPMDAFYDFGTFGYEMFIKKGAKKILTGFNMSEREFLFQRGSKFKVVGKRLLTLERQGTTKTKIMYQLEFIE